VDDEDGPITSSDTHCLSLHHARLHKDALAAHTTPLGSEHPNLV